MITTTDLPYKSVAVALLFCVALGPIGLLYASFWGGTIMLLLSIVVISMGKFLFVTLLLWLACCVWGVRAVESYNKKLMTIYAKKNY